MAELLGELLRSLLWGRVAVSLLQAEALLRALGWCHLRSLPGRREKERCQAGPLLSGLNLRNA